MQRRCCPSTSTVELTVSAEHRSLTRVAGTVAMTGPGGAPDIHKPAGADTQRRPLERAAQAGELELTTHSRCLRCWCWRALRCSADRPSDLCSQLGGLSRRSEYEIGDPSTASAIIHLSSSFESDERGCAPGHNVVISYGDGDVERMPRIELA